MLVLGEKGEKTCKRNGHGGKGKGCMSIVAGEDGKDGFFSFHQPLLFVFFASTTISKQDGWGRFQWLSRARGDEPCLISLFLRHLEIWVHATLAPGMGIMHPNSGPSGDLFTIICKSGNNASAVHSRQNVLARVSFHWMAHDDEDHPVGTKSGSPPPVQKVVDHQQIKGYRIWVMERE